MITEVITQITSTAVPYDLIGAYDYIWLHNATTGKIYKWIKGLASGKAFEIGAALIAANGFTPFKKKNSFTPVKGKITAITKATQAVVTLADTPTFTVNQIVRFSVQSTYGMTQINGKQGKVIAVDTTAKTITVDIDTTTFTAFVVPEPVSGIAEVSLAGIAPTCDGICGISGVAIGSQTYGVTLGTAIVGAAGDVIIIQGSVAVEGCDCG